MKKMDLLNFMLLLVLSLSRLGGAVENGGQPGAFLFLTQNARSSSLGYSGIVNQNGMWAYQFNPALAGLVNYPSLSLQYANLSLDRELYALAISVPGLKQMVNVQLGWNGLKVGQIQGRDEMGNPTENFSILHTVANLTIAINSNNDMWEGFRYITPGFNLKWIYSDLYAIRGYGLTGDAGIFIGLPRDEEQAPYRFQIGITVSDFFGQLNWTHGYTESFSRRLRGGILYSPFTWLNVVAEATYWENEYMNYSFGIEAALRNILYLRGGWNSDFGITFGAGFALDTFARFRLNYSQLQNDLNQQIPRLWDISLGW